MPLKTYSEQFKRDALVLYDSAIRGSGPMRS